MGDRYVHFYPFTGRWDHRQEIFDAEKERLLKEMEYIKRNISGQNVTQARGRLRRLTRRLQAIEQVGIEAVTSKAWGELSEEVDTTTSLMGVEEAERRVRALSLPSSRPPHLHLNLRADLRGIRSLRRRNLGAEQALRPDSSIRRR